MHQVHFERDAASCIQGREALRSTEISRLACNRTRVLQSCLPAIAEWHTTTPCYNSGRQGAPAHLGCDAACCPQGREVLRSTLALVTKDRVHPAVRLACSNGIAYHAAAACGVRTTAENSDDALRQRSPTRKQRQASKNTCPKKTSTKH